MNVSYQAQNSLSFAEMMRSMQPEKMFSTNLHNLLYFLEYNQSASHNASVSDLKSSVSGTITELESRSPVQGVVSKSVLTAAELN